MVVVYFADAGVPKTGLSPTVDIYDVSDNSLDVNDGAMSEIGGGFYKYNFTGHDATKDYAFVADGTSTLGNSDRYAAGIISENKDAVIDAIKTKTDNLPSGVPKNVALSNFEFLMVDSADHVSPKTGLTVTAQISKDGGSFAACTNSVTEVGNGVYKINLTQTEMNADVITLIFTASGANQTTITFKTSS